MRDCRIYLAGPPFAEDYRVRASAIILDRGGIPVNPMLRDFRGREAGNEAEIVLGDVREILSCDVILGDFTEADEGTSMECWQGHALGVPVVAFVEGRRVSPWLAYIADVHQTLDQAVEFLRPNKTFRASTLLP